MVPPPLSFPLLSAAKPLQQGWWQLPPTHLIDDMLDEGLAQVIAFVRRYDLRQLLPIVPCLVRQVLDKGIIHIVKDHAIDIGLHIL